MLNIIVTSLTQSATNWKNRTVIFIFIASNKKCDVWTHGVVEKAICHEHWLRVTIVSFNLTMEKYYKAAMEKYYKVLLVYFCGWTKYLNLRFRDRCQPIVENVVKCAQFRSKLPYKYLLSNPQNTPALRFSMKL